MLSVFVIYRIFFTRTGAHPRLREGHASLENASFFFFFAFS
jgi:hypothetical protein